MSKVYIEGMKMPKCCGECRFCNRIDNWFFCKANEDKDVSRSVNCGQRNKYCPLMEVNK